MKETLGVYTLSESCSLPDKNLDSLLNASHCTIDYRDEVGQRADTFLHSALENKCLNLSTSVQLPIIREMAGAILYYKG